MLSDASVSVPNLGQRPEVEMILKLRVRCSFCTKQCNNPELIWSVPFDEATGGAE